jgi:hypothetical protein
VGGLVTQVMPATPELVILVVLVISGGAIVGFLFQWLSGKRDDSKWDPRVGFWRPPKLPEDEWEKWGKL